MGALSFIVQEYLRELSITEGGFAIWINNTIKLPRNTSNYKLQFD